MKKLRISLLTLLSVLGVITLAYAAYTSRPITDNTIKDFAPDISNNGNIVWVERTPGSDDIYLWDRLTDSIIPLITNTAADEVPRINSDGDVVWRAFNNALIDYEILYWDASTGVTTVISLPDTPYPVLDFPNEPIISDNGQVVWWTSDGNDFEIHYFNGTSSFAITDNTTGDEKPTLNNLGDVVWQHNDGNDVEIFLYDAASGTTQPPLTNNDVSDINPWINDPGDVVWSGFDGTDNEIFFYDRSTGVTTQLTDNTFDDLKPQINNAGQIAWGADVTTTNSDIWFREGLAGANVNLSSNGNTDCCFQLSETGTVVWGSDQGNLGVNNDIFVHDGTALIRLTDDMLDDIVPVINDLDEIAWQKNDGIDDEIFLATLGTPCVPVACPDDGNPCTTEFFDADPSVCACVTENNTMACEDGSPCTLGDLCSGGICEPGAPKDCDDLAFCNGTETCNETNGNCDSSGNPCNTATETCNENDDTCDPVCVPTGNPDTNCDGVDDDCLNGPDDGFVPVPTTCGLGICASTGIETCVDGILVDSCSPGAPDTEICDGLDNDCDGTADESLTRGTTCGAGVCSGNTGVETCVDGAWVGDTCDPLDGASAEVCDNLDNDCDGTTDENLIRGTSCGVGECAGNIGIETCTAGMWGSDTCDPLDGASAEVCDNLDNDCDGTTDENLTRGTTCGAGECAGNTGTETCTAGMWGGDTCDPLDGASAEVCDNLDNDCDGTTDENLTRGTTCGVGECAGNTGTETCTAGAWVGDTCDPLDGATAEVCDNLDNDCDGTTDENLTRGTTCGVGECAGNTGTETCTAGAWVGDTCDPLGGATAEVCDNLDNDCNGVTDDGITPIPTTCGVGECAANGQVTCVGGVLVDDCTPGAPSAEVCDGLDNDCDGAVDDNLTRGTTCGVGECAGNTGTETCTAGAWGDDTCDPLGGSTPEVCDNLDNDCDGTTDENLTRGTTCGVGECAGNTGTETCTAGTWVGDTCDPLDGAIPEVCDNLDNDCDGLVDDGIATSPTTCGLGECSATGEMACIGGVMVDSCVPGDPSPEVCDNLDNDCDGTTDEGCECIDNETRNTTCGVGECAGNTGTQTCTNGTWGIDTCDPLGGAAAEVCDNLDNDCDGATDENLTRNTNCGVGACAGNTGIEICTNGLWGDDTCDPLDGAGVEGPSGDASCSDGVDNDCDGLTDVGDGDCDDVCLNVDCNDNNPCTDDSCDGSSGAPICVNTPNTLPCNDGDACTMGDTCSDGDCIGSLVTCNDNNPCTNDTCNPSSGCVFTNNTDPCNDFNACTDNDVCSGGSCVSGPPLNCDDNDACTGVETCDPVNGCIPGTPVECGPGESCNPATGGCEPFCTDDTQCDDGQFCNGGETCDLGTNTCVAGSYPCDPGQPCDETQDICVCTGIKSTTVRGGGQRPTTTDLQIQVQFTVLGSGGIVSETASTLVVCPGTVMAFNCKVGDGPEPSSGTLDGDPLNTDALQIIICDETVTGDGTHKLILENKGNGGKDTDRITIKLAK